MKQMLHAGVGIVLACLCLASCEKKVADSHVPEIEVRKDAQALLGMWMLPEGFEYLEVKPNGDLVMYDNPGWNLRHTGQYKFVSPGVLEWRWNLKNDKGEKVPSPWSTIDFEVGGNPTRLSWCSRAFTSRTMRYYVKYERP